jgi:hypothetical protein
MAGLSAENELIVAGLSMGVVYSIFQAGAVNLADVRADDQGNENTFKSAKTSAWTAAAAVAGLALLSKSPTVLIVGGVTLLAETWKNHFANYGSHRGQPVNQGS